MNSLQRLWTHSILVRVAVVLTAVTVLALAVMTAAWVFTQQSMGKGSAINVAGSLRMQSYALAVAVASPGGDARMRTGVRTSDFSTMRISPRAARRSA